MQAVIVILDEAVQRFVPRVLGILDQKSVRSGIDDIPVPLNIRAYDGKTERRVIEILDTAFCAIEIRIDQRRNADMPMIDGFKPAHECGVGFAEFRWNLDRVAPGRQFLQAVDVRLL